MLLLVYAYDFNSIFAAGTPHTAAEALLMLLESSGNPLIHPLDLNVLNPDYPFELCLRAIHKLSTPRKNVFLYLTMFLHEFIEQNRNANIEVIGGYFLFKKGVAYFLLNRTATVC